MANSSSLIYSGEGGVLQTADGQILTNDEGNPITSNIKQVFFIEVYPFLAYVLAC